MTKKKIAYIGAGIVALVLGYFNYFGSDKETGDIRKLIETSMQSMKMMIFV